MTPTVACTCETRPDHAVALKLLVASLRRNCPALPLHVYGVLEQPSSGGLQSWLRERGATLRPLPADALEGWSVKPAILRDVVRRAATPALWLDADLLVQGDLAPLLPDDPGVVVTCEDVHDVPTPGSAPRLQGLGWTPQRHFPWTVNTCLLRVSPAHLVLLAAWQRELQREDFRAAQRLALGQRPCWLQGDQDLLTALLAATFADVPVKMLVSGRDIVHAMAARLYTPRQRLRHVVRGMAPLIHAIGSKPWLAAQRSRWADVSPYVMLARNYRDELGDPLPWTGAITPLGRMLRLLACRHAALAGLPLSMLAQLTRRV